MAFALEFPIEPCGIAVKQANSANVTAVHLIDYIRCRAKADRCSIKHQSRRPFVLAHRLMQKNQRLHHR